MSYYKAKQDQLRDEAMAMQVGNLYHLLGINDESDGEEYEECYSYGELSHFNDYFTKMGKRYGLLEEFRTEGIIY